jgi:hypothetical protein
MASSKRAFAPRAFAGRAFAPAAYRGVGVETIDVVDVGLFDFVAYRDLAELTGLLMDISHIVIGDDFPFLLRNARSGLTGAALSAATATWQLLAEDRLTVVDSGSMSNYADPDYPSGKSFIANVPDAVTALLLPTRTYYLKAKLDNAGSKTSKSTKLKAAELIEAEV